MWSHYADGHRGVVIGVEIDTHVNKIEEIEYDGLLTIPNPIINVTEEMGLNILTHKDPIWSYEREARVFITEGIYVPCTVLELRCGLSMSNANRSLLNKIVKKVNPRIKITRAEKPMFRGINGQ